VEDGSLIIYEAFGSQKGMTDSNHASTVRQCHETLTAPQYMTTQTGQEQWARTYRVKHMKGELGATGCMYHGENLKRALP